MLYHGSNHYIESFIEPRMSFDYTPLVYATENPFYALVRAGRFNPNEFLIKEDFTGSHFTLIELEDGAIEKVLDTDGYIYEVDKRQFTKNHEGLPNEYISTKNCIIKNRVYIKNILRTIELISKIYGFFTIIRNQDSEEYWKTVRGGKEGYLQRRKERLEKLEVKRMNKPTRCIDPIFKCCNICPWGWVKYPDWVETSADLEGCSYEDGCMLGFENDEPTEEELKEFEEWEKNKCK